MGDRILAWTLILFGFGCIGCEVLGAYEYLWEQRGKWDYLVVGGMLVTAGAGLLPLAGEFARRKQQWKKMVCCYVAIPFALLFVLVAGVTRTSLVADTDVAARTTRELALRTAQEEIEEAKKQRIKDQVAVDSNCAIWGPKCTQAKEDLRATEAKLAAARRSVTSGAMITQNDWTKRIVAFLPFLTEAQVQLYHPLLLPLMLGVLGALCVGIGAHRGSRVSEVKPVAPAPAVAPRPEAVEPMEASPPPRPSKPRLVPKGTPHEADVFRIFRTALVRAKGSHVELSDLRGRYDADGGSPCQPNEFMRAVMAHCRAERIKTAEIDDRPCLLDVTLAPMAKRESA
jgi:hypothetical protein